MSNSVLCIQHHILEKLCSDGNLVLIRFHVEQLRYDTQSELLLHAASATGHLDVVKYLVLDVNVSLDWLAVSLAAEGGHSHVVAFLVKVGAPVSAGWLIYASMDVCDRRVTIQLNYPEDHCFFDKAIMHKEIKPCILSIIDSYVERNCYLYGLSGVWTEYRCRKEIAKTAKIYQRELQSAKRRIYLKLLFTCKLLRVYKSFLVRYYSPNGKGAFDAREHFEIASKK